MRRPSFGRFIYMLVFSLVLLSYGFSQSNEDVGDGEKYELKFYLGADGIYKNIRGDFDGENFLTSGDEEIALPSLDPSFLGGGFVVGIAFDKNYKYKEVMAGFSLSALLTKWIMEASDKYALELSYFFSAHDASYLELTNSAFYHLFNIDARLHFGSEPLQVCSTLGFGVPILVTENTYYHSVTETFADTVFRGVLVNLGLGIEYYFGNHISIGTSFIGRFGSISSVRVVGNESAEIDGGVSLFDLSPEILIKYTF